jgi:hypothetical protein
VVQTPDDASVHTLSKKLYLNSEPPVMQVCIFRQKNCTSIAQVAGWLQCFFILLFFIIF